MAYLTQDQVREIIKKAPTGTSPAGIVAALRKQGHTLEGFDVQEQPQERNTLQKVGKFVKDTAVSGAKSFLETSFRNSTLANQLDPTGYLRKQLPETVKLPGLGETSIRYSDDPKKRLTQYGEDVLNVAPTEGIGAATRAIKNRIVTKVSREAYEVVKPELNKLGKIEAVKAGRATKNVFGKIDITPVERDLQIAKAVEGVVSKKRGFIQNITSIRNEISKEADSVVRNLEKNKIPFSKQEIVTKLNAIEAPLDVQADAVVAKKYEIAKEKFMKFVEGEDQTLSGLLKARKKFDKWVEEKIPNIWDDSHKALHQALRDMRTTANDFIAEKLPNGSTFKKSLRRQNLMYDAVSNIAEKSYKDVGTSALGRKIKSSPVLRQTLKYGGAVGAGAIGVSTLKN